MVFICFYLSPFICCFTFFDSLKCCFILLREFSLASICSHPCCCCCILMSRLGLECFSWSLLLNCSWTQVQFSFICCFIPSFWTYLCYLEWLEFFPSNLLKAFLLQWVVFDFKCFWITQTCLRCSIFEVSTHGFLLC